MPEISIIVPVYNMGKYISQCIESILSQSFVDFELVLVDDGSKDNSFEICQYYANLDKRIYVIHKKNEGVSVARNTGIQKSTGKYITFVDADDWIMPNYLEILHGNLSKYRAEISVCDIEWISERTSKRTDCENNIVQYSGLEAIHEYAINSYNKFRLTGAKLIKREIVEKIPFPKDRTISEDMAVIYKWYNVAEKIVDSDSKLYNYFQNTNGASQEKFSIKKIQLLQTLEEVLLFLEKNHLTVAYEKILHEYLFKASWQCEMISKELGNKEVAVDIQKKIKKIVCQNKRKFKLTPKTDTYAFNIAYPKQMEIYWKFNYIVSLYKKEGILFVFKVFIRKVKRK